MHYWTQRRKFSRKLHRKTYDLPLFSNTFCKAKNLYFVRRWPQKRITKEGEAAIEEL
jgi:hypothetical protein